MWRIRRAIYRWGFRPKRGSIFFSPSQALIYSYLDSIAPGAIVRYKNK